MTFDEDTTYNKSRKKPVEESEEAEAPRVHDTTMNEEDREFEEPQTPIDPPLEKNPHKRKPSWVPELIQGAVRTYPRWRKIWGSRRESQRKKEDQIMLRVCSFTM